MRQSYLLKFFALIFAGLFVAVNAHANTDYLKYVPERDNQVDVRLMNAYVALLGSDTSSNLPVPAGNMNICEYVELTAPFFTQEERKIMFYGDENYKDSLFRTILVQKNNEWVLSDNIRLVSMKELDFNDIECKGREQEHKDYKTSRAWTYIYHYAHSLNENHKITPSANTLPIYYKPSSAGMLLTDKWLAQLFNLQNEQMLRDIAAFAKQFELFNSDQKQDDEIAKHLDRIIPVNRYFVKNNLGRNVSKAIDSNPFKGEPQEEKEYQAKEYKNKFYLYFKNKNGKYPYEDQTDPGYIFSDKYSNDVILGAPVARPMQSRAYSLAAPSALSAGPLSPPNNDTLTTQGADGNGTTVDENADFGALRDELNRRPNGSNPVAPENPSSTVDAGRTAPGSADPGALTGGVAGGASGTTVYQDPPGRVRGAPDSETIRRQQESLAADNNSQGAADSDGNSSGFSGDAADKARNNNTGENTSNKELQDRLAKLEAERAAEKEAAEKRRNSGDDDTSTNKTPSAGSPSLGGGSPGGGGGGGSGKGGGGGAGGGGGPGKGGGKPAGDGPLGGSGRAGMDRSAASLLGELGTAKDPALIEPGSDSLAKANLGKQQNVRPLGGGPVMPSGSSQAFNPSPANTPSTSQKVASALSSRPRTSYTSGVSSNQYRKILEDRNAAEKVAGASGVSGAAAASGSGQGGSNWKGDYNKWFSSVFDTSGGGGGGGYSGSYSTWRNPSYSGSSWSSGGSNSWGSGSDNNSWSWDSAGNNYDYDSSDSVWDYNSDWNYDSDYGNEFKWTYDDNYGMGDGDAGVSSIWTASDMQDVRALIFSKEEKAKLMGKKFAESGPAGMSSKEKDQVNTLVEEADSLIGQKKYYEAIEKADEILKHDNIPFAYIIKAEAALGLQEYQDAYEQSELALREVPLSTRVLTVRSIAAENLGKYRAMLASLQRLTEIDASKYNEKYQTAIEQYRNEAPEFLTYWDKKERLPSAVTASRSSGFAPQTKWIGYILVAMALAILLGIGIVMLMSPKPEEIEMVEEEDDGSAQMDGAELVNVNGYEAKRLMEEGPSGNLYEGINTALKLDVSMRQLPMPKQKMAAAKEHIKQYTKVRHTNLAETFSVQEDDNAIYIISQYLPGTELIDLLAQCPESISTIKSVKIFISVTKGLEHMHHLKLVNGGMHLEDIVVDEDLSSIANLGLGTVVNRDVGEDAVYKAPEGSAQGFTQAYDIYSMGVCLYKSVTGEFPKKGVAASRLAQIPAELDQLLNSMLADNPAERPSAEEVLAQLMVVKDVLTPKPKKEEATEAAQPAN